LIKIIVQLSIKLILLVSLFLIESNCPIAKASPFNQKNKNTVQRLEANKFNIDSYLLAHSAARLNLRKDIIYKWPIQKNFYRQQPDDLILAQNRLAIALCKIAKYFEQKNENEIALQLYHSVLEYYKQTNQKTELGKVYNKIGLINQNYEKDYHAAKSNFNKAIQNFSEAHDSLNLALTLNKMAELAQTMGQIDEAKSFFKQSAFIQKSIKKDTEFAQVSLNLSILEYASGNIEDAFQGLLACESIFSKTNANKYGLGRTYSYLALILSDKGKYKNAEDYALKAYQISLELGDWELTKHAVDLLQKIHKKLGKWDSALNYLEIFHQFKDSLNQEQQKNTVEKEQMKFEFEKKRLADSLYFLKTQLEKDFIISQQETQLNSTRRIRNVTIIGTLLILFSAWLLINRFEITQKQKQDELKIAALELEQKLLRVQMNPMFIFKTLQAIQNFIESSQFVIARRFLLKFSKLMRLVLEQSKKTEIPICEEIETLKLYLDMEQLRFQNYFQYKFIELSNLQAFDLKIPPTIIQPFLEEIIVERLINGPKNCTIEIVFSYIDPVLQVTITDDGNPRNENIKNSDAIKLSMERIKTMNRNHAVGNVIAENINGKNKLSLYFPIASNKNKTE